MALADVVARSDEKVSQAAAVEEVKKARKELVAQQMAKGESSDHATSRARVELPLVSTRDPANHGFVTTFNRSARQRKGQLLRLVENAPPQESWAWEQRAHDFARRAPVYGLTFMTAPGQLEGEKALRLGDQLVRVNGVSALGHTAEAPQALLDQLFGAAGVARLELKFFRTSDFQRDNQHAFAQAMSTGKDMVCSLFFIV
jgi:hypothetical protein